MNNFLEARILPIESFRLADDCLHVWITNSNTNDFLPPELSNYVLANGLETRNLRQRFLWLVPDKNSSESLMSIRNTAAESIRQLPDTYKFVHVYAQADYDALYALLDGLFLGAYRFLKYKSQPKKYATPEIVLYSSHTQNDERILKERKHLAEAVCFARDLVNEPYSALNAVSLAEAAEAMAASYNIKCEVLNLARITSLKMGGLLAVNKGSVIPPTFTILEYAAPNTENTPPIVLVGKGVVYDTGGLSLKPTPDSMDYMKSDMAGAATVLGIIKAAAANQLPVRLVGLIPATDNILSSESYAPGDIITMFNGTTVEVMNTDAEGRLILADALAYAAKYNPRLVIDFATLTGSAVRAIGTIGAVGMGTASDETKRKLKNSGDVTGERWVEFPLWDSYAEELNSELADLKNLGGPNAGAITAGKFLEHFCDFPWMHFDVAGPAFLTKTSGINTKGGTGFGVRLIHHFLNNFSKTL